MTKTVIFSCGEYDECFDFYALEAPDDPDIDALWLEFHGGVRPKHPWDKSRSANQKPFNEMAFPKWLETEKGWRPVEVHGFWVGGDDWCSWPRVELRQIEPPKERRT